MKLGLCTTLFIIFLILKLVGVIAWSWWIVTLPLWIIPVIIIVFCCSIGIVILAKIKGK